HAGGLDHDTQHARGDIRRREGQGRVPLVERPVDRHGGAHGKRDRRGWPGHHEHGDVLREADQRERQRCQKAEGDGSHRLTPDRSRSFLKLPAWDADVAGSQKWKLTATKGPFKETFSVSRFPCRSMSMYRHPRIADAGREKRHSSPPRRLYVSLV